MSLTTGTDLKEMNKGKIDGEPFHYPSTFLLLLGYAKVFLYLPYRQTKEGIAQGHGPWKGSINSRLRYNKQKNK
jgi:hypothetical protein